MKFRKYAASVLAGTLVMTLGTTTMAGGFKGLPPGLAKKGKLPPGIAKQIFRDLKGYNWATKYIEDLGMKGLVKGEGNGVFAPYRSVTKLESIIMSLRIMGWEEEAKQTEKITNKYKGKSVADWAKGYIQVAYEKGILDDVDMMYFNPTDPAKRYEVAKYVIRAIGYEDEAQEHMDEDLDFEDSSAVPQGAVGYVYLIDDLGIMKGNNDRFNPMGTLTRAEMAVLFSRLDDKVENEVDDSEIKGTIKDVEDDEISVRVDGETKSYEVDEDVVVYNDDYRIYYDELKRGMNIEATVKNGKLVYIEVVEDLNEDRIITEYTGRVEKVKDDKIAVQIKEMVAMFEVIDDVEVLFDGEKGKLEDIEKGDTVTVTVDKKNRARKIELDKELEKESDKEEVNGKIKDIDLNGIYHITIDEERYKLDEEAEVKIDGDKAELEDLEIDMDVEAKLQDEIITEIEADTEDVIEEAEGKIEILDLEGIYTIEIYGERYKLDKEAEVKIDGNKADLEDLVIGMKSEVKIENGTVTKIKAENVEFSFEGEIEEISSTKNGTKLTIKMEDKDVSYIVDEDVKIENDDEEIDLDNLEVGQEGEFEVINNVIVEIELDD